MTTVPTDPGAAATGRTAGETRHETAITVIRPGQRVLDVTLEAYHRGEIHNIALRERHGRWLVLLFYPADFTFVCPTELAAFAEHQDAFDEAGADVMSVSTDTVFAHKAWHDSSPLVGRVAFPMLADPSGTLCRSFGTYLEDEGVSLRATFLIDPAGVVQALEIHTNSIGRNAAETLRMLRAAIHVSAFENEVCPAAWQPGAPTLEPSLALAGQL